MAPSQPPRKGPPRPDLDFFLPGDDQAPMQHTPPGGIEAHEHALKPTSPFIFTLKDLVAAAIALIGVVSSYYILKGSVASAEEKAQVAIVSAAKVEVVEKRVNRHDTDLAVVEKKVDAFEKDLNRRFQEVKDEQRAGEQRILDAVKELRGEVRRSR